MNRPYSQFSEKILAELVDGRPILHDHFGKPKRERMVVAKAFDDTTSIRSSNPVVPTVTRRDFIVLMA